jgi:uncharacterized protein
MSAGKARVKGHLVGPAPTRFDALKVAARGESLAGAVEVRRLPRLAETVVAVPEAGEPTIRWRIVGGKDAKNHPQLDLRLDGELFVTCQRCLKPLAVTIDQHTVLLLARDESELLRLDAEEPEVVPASAPLDALTLVEDELLLSLPFAPRHGDGACKAAIAAADAGSRESAFAQLAGMKTGRRTKK